MYNDESINSYTWFGKLELVKDSHKDTEHEEYPYLDDNRLYLSKCKFDNINIKATSEGIEQRLIVTLCSSPDGSMDTIIQFICLSETDARYYYAVLKSFYESNEKQLTMSADRLWMIKSCALGDDAYGSESWFDPIRVKPGYVFFWDT